MKQVDLSIRACGGAILIAMAFLFWFFGMQLSAQFHDEAEQVLQRDQLGNIVRAALSSDDIGLWALIRDGDEMYLDDSITNLFPTSLKVFADLENVARLDDIVEMLHPDDRERFTALLVNAYENKEGFPPTDFLGIEDDELIRFHISAGIAPYDDYKWLNHKGKLLAGFVVIESRMPLEGASPPSP